MTYLLASVLNLSQKQSQAAVVVLLIVCSLWTWLVILALDWWTTASGWKRIARALVPLLPLVILLWSAILFFRPELPPISYPWLSANTIVGKSGEKITAVQLHLVVREDPPSREGPENATPLSSLYDLNVTVFEPQIVTPTGPYFCSVAKPLKVVEWNNSDAIRSPVGVFQLKRETNVLWFTGSSRGATWEGAAVIDRNGDWEETLTGWVSSGKNRQRVRVEEARRNGKTLGKLDHPVRITPELLVRYGVPFHAGFDPAADSCPAAE